jgi:GntR family transcriptional repressor for pyruvate dehydrogenase complex
MERNAMFSGVSLNKMSNYIISQVREAILTGKVQPGDRLPTEKELVEQFHVSKHTLREALRALEFMGLLEIRKGAGGGPFVLEVDMETTRNSIINFLHFQNVSVRDLSDVRKVFEPHLARVAAEQATPELIETLSSLNEGCRKLLENGESLVGAREEIDFHVHLAKAGGNPVMMLILDFVNNLLTNTKSNLKPEIDFCENVLAAHEAILEKIRAGDGDGAAQAMYRHVCEVETGLQHLEEKEKIPRFHPRDHK